MHSTSVLNTLSAYHGAHIHTHTHAHTHTHKQKDLNIASDSEEDEKNLNPYSSSSHSSESSSLDLLDFRNRVTESGQKLEEKYLDLRGRPLPPGYEAIEPIPLSEDYLHKHPEVLEDFKNGKMDMLDPRDVLTQPEIDIHIGKIQVFVM